LRIYRIKEASALEESRFGLMLEAIFEIAMVVLVRLRVNDNHVIDPRFPDELQIWFQGLRGRFVDRVDVIGKPPLVFREEVYVGIDENAGRAAGAGSRKKAEGAADQLSAR
jgi:hypothetical protein